MEVFSQLLCLAVLVLVAADPTDYLDDNYCAADLCPRGVRHIACGATVQLASTCPEDTRLVEITPMLKEFILDQINEKRNFIAGGLDSKHRPACRMATTQWDDELAALAAINARRCKLGHDSCHNTKTFLFSGQLIAGMRFKGYADDKQMFENAINRWYDQVEHSNMSFINSYPANNLGLDVGYFTVLMSERNIRVGCAVSDFSLLYLNYRSYLIVCNSAYNIVVNEPVYESCKTGGTKCKSGNNLEYPNLCSKSEEYEMTPNIPNWPETTSKPELAGQTAREPTRELKTPRPTPRPTLMSILISMPMPKPMPMPTTTTTTTRKPTRRPHRKPTPTPSILASAKLFGSLVSVVTH